MKQSLLMIAVMMMAQSVFADPKCSQSVELNRGILGSTNPKNAYLKAPVKQDRTAGAKQATGQN